MLKHDVAGMMFHLCNLSVACTCLAQFGALGMHVKRQTCRPEPHVGQSMLF
jgi:hypothetical protein